LRSKLQHAFATAVETVTTFTREPLKFGAGPENWRRFNSLMGSALAFREGTAPVPGVPTHPKEIVKELNELSRELRVRERLKGWTQAVQTVGHARIGKRYKFILLILSLKDSTIRATAYEERSLAQAAIREIEQLKRDDLDVVLVWVNSVRGLKKAYPNYYADTTDFLAAHADILKGRI
jgi:hypothetical protein